MFSLASLSGISAACAGLQSADKKDSTVNRVGVSLMVVMGGLLDLDGSA
jgi:hypothetical protein